MSRPRPTPEDILAQGLPLEAAFQRFAPARKLPDDRPPLASLMPTIRPEQADVDAEVLLGLQVIRDTINKHDELTRNRWSRFRAQLVSGRLTAAGYATPRAPGDAPVFVPQELWLSAAVDLSLSSMSAGASAYEGLRVARTGTKKRGAA